MNLAVIPAKGTSTRLPRKNVREFFGKPMLVHSIETAQRSQLFSHIVVSTDDEFIAAIAVKAGAYVISRPPALCEKGVPDCGTQEVTRHAILDARTILTNPPPEAVCCIYATAPLMTVTDLQAGYASLMGPEREIAFVHSADPYGHDAGQWYWGTAHAFINRTPLNGPYTEKYKLPWTRVCDINTIEDWYTATRLYQAMHGWTPLNVDKQL